MKFGGFLVNADPKGLVTIKPDPDRIEAVHQMSQPTNKQEAQSFFGYLNCLKPWLPSISQQTPILRELCKKGTTFLWTDEAEEEFQLIRKAVQDYVTLTAFDPSKGTTLDIDACFEAGFGFVLHQTGEDNEMRIVLTGST